MEIKGVSSHGYGDGDDYTGVGADAACLCDSLEAHMEVVERVQSLMIPGAESSDLRWCLAPLQGEKDGM
jgi:hypothetical protein